MTRYKFIDELLSDKHHDYNITQLTEKVNEKLEAIGEKPVCKRSIEKDLNYLEGEPFNADLKRTYEHGKSYIHYEDDTFSIFTKKLTSDEQQLLNEVLSTIGQFNGLENFEWLDSLKKKLGKEDTEQQKIIYYSNNPYLENKKFLGQLFSAASNKTTLEITYQPFKLEKEKFIFYPYVIKQYNSRWFVFGKKQDDNKIQNLAIDRIQSIRPKNRLPFINSEIDFNEYFEDIVGVSFPPESKTEDILLWVSDKSNRYVETKSLHESQRFFKKDSAIDQKLRKQYPSLSGGNFIKLECIVNYELKQLIASMLGEVIVLSPESLRNEMMEKGRKMMEKYEILRK